MEAFSSLASSPPPEAMWGGNKRDSVVAQACLGKVEACLTAGAWAKASAPPRLFPPPTAARGDNSIESFIKEYLMPLWLWGFMDW